MVSSTLFSDMHGTADPGGAIPKVATGALAEIVCRGGGKSSQVASQGMCPGAVSTALQRLIRIVMELSAPDSGWPTELPQTPETLAPYISEEVDELFAALSQAPTLSQEPPANLGFPEVMTLPPTFVLTTLIPMVLWHIASRGYEITRLLEGIQAQIQTPEGDRTSGLVRLVPVLGLGEGQMGLRIDLVTQTALGSLAALPPETLFQLADGDLQSPLLSVQDWLTAITQQVERGNPWLQSLLNRQGEITYLVPGDEWRFGGLTLEFLFLALESPPPLSTPTSEQSDFASLHEWVTDILGPMTCEPAAPELSLEDIGAIAAITQGSRVLAPKPGAIAGDTLLADWLTFTDEAWIQRFLQEMAQSLLHQHILTYLAPNALDEVGVGDAEGLWLVHAACEAVNQVQSSEGLFKPSFVQQPLQLADLWPRLRWYLARSSQLVMQLMGGLPVRWLSPGSPWQTGWLFLQPFLKVHMPRVDSGEEARFLDLTSGQVWPELPPAAPEGALIYPLLPDLGTALVPLSEIAQTIRQTLAHQALALIAPGDKIAIDLYRFDLAQAHQPGYLEVGWQLVLQT